jgi:hypothetical protein
LAPRAGVRAASAFNRLAWLTPLTATFDRKGLFGALANRESGDAVSEKKRRQTQGTSAEESTQTNRTICVLTLAHSDKGSAPSTARPGSTASIDAGLRLQGRETLCRQNFRAHRTMGEKPSTASVAPQERMRRRGRKSYPQGHPDRLHGPGAPAVMKKLRPGYSVTGPCC